MKNWWRKWSYEIPLAFGDALWEVLVVQFADFLSRLTIRRVLEFVAIAILVMAFIQTLPIDLAILFAGDTLMYLEFVVHDPARGRTRTSSGDARALAATAGPARDTSVDERHVDVSSVADQPLCANGARAPRAARPRRISGSVRRRRRCFGVDTGVCCAAA